MPLRTIHPRFLLLVGSLAACSSSSTTSTSTTGPQFEIRGDDLSGRQENVLVTVGGVAQSGITVTVNGAALTDAGGGQYSGTLASTVAAGGAIQLIVTDGVYTATGNTVVPAAPTITAATVASPGAPVVVTWATPTSPDSFEVTLNYHLPDNSSAAVVARLAGSARQVSLPQSEILAGGVVFSVGLQAMMTGTFSGSAASGSAMNVRAESPDYPFTLP